MSSGSILITGCSSGIGFQVAQGLRARGWRVFATARKPEDIAPMIAFIASAGAGWVTGQVVSINGGYSMVG